MNVLSCKMCSVFVFLHLICKLMWIDTLASASLQRNRSKKMQPLWIPPGKAAPIFNSLKSMIVFFWEFVLCSNLRFNLFTVTIFDSNSIVWLACGIQLCQIQSVHWGNNIWNMMCELRPEISFIWHLVASFWQQFFWFPLYIWSKNYLHFHISCPNNKNAGLTSVTTSQ